VQGLELRNVQMDGMWTFVQKRGGRMTREEMHNTAIGDQFIFYGIDRDTKLIPGWAIGKRNGDTTNEFLRMMRNSIDNSPQFSADGFQAYPWNLGKHFPNPDLGVVIKNYAAIEAKRGRYASPEVQSITKKASLGTPHLEDTCTSHIERANLTVRTLQARMTRLSLCFSKKLENLKAACALHFCYMNFCWVPRTQKVTPAMAAGVADRVWDVSDLVPEWWIMATRNLAQSISAVLPQSNPLNSLRPYEA
jgi:IS1 family transposase